MQSKIDEIKKLAEEKISKIKNSQDLLQVYASLLLLRDGNAAAYQLLLAVSMFCPLVSVLLVQKFWLHQPTGISWRPRLKGNGRYLLAAGPHRRR